MEIKRIVIFGATSSMAEAVARLWAARGVSLYLVGRNAQKLLAIEQDLRVRAGQSITIAAAQADLDDTAGHAALIERACEALGGLDAALIAHGTLPDQARCQADPREALAQIHTNGLSVVSLCTLLANRLEAQGIGCIAVITSVAGDRGRQSNYIYGAAKGMVSRFLQGLRNRLAPRGVAVVDFRPGYIDTPMTIAYKKNRLWAQPKEVAQDIVQGMDRGRDVVYLPRYWRLVMLVIRLIPEFVFKRLKL